MGTCVCGHGEDEHGGDKDYPGSTACHMGSTDPDKNPFSDNCECVAYEAAEEEARP